MVHEIAQFGSLSFDQYNIPKHKNLNGLKQLVEGLEASHNIRRHNAAIQRFLEHTYLFGEDAHTNIGLTSDEENVNLNTLYTALQKRFNEITNTPVNFARFREEAFREFQFLLELLRRLHLNNILYQEGVGDVARPYYQSDSLLEEDITLPQPSFFITADDIDFRSLTKILSSHADADTISMTLSSPITLFLDISSTADFEFIQDVTNITIVSQTTTPNSGRYVIAFDAKQTPQIRSYSLRGNSVHEENTSSYTSNEIVFNLKYKGTDVNLHQAVIWPHVLPTDHINYLLNSGF